MGIIAVTTTLAVADIALKQGTWTIQKQMDSELQSELADAP